MMMLPWSLGARVRVHVNEKKERERGQKRLLCIRKQKKKTNYIFITIIDMITIIIAFNYCQSSTYIIIDIVCWRFKSIPFPHTVYTLCYYYPIMIITVTVITAIVRDCIIVCTRCVDSETIYKLFTISRHIYVLGKLYKKKRRDRLERLKWEDTRIDWCETARSSI